MARQDVQALVVRFKALFLICKLRFYKSVNCVISFWVVLVMGGIGTAICSVSLCLVFVQDQHILC